MTAYVEWVARPLAQRPARRSSTTEIDARRPARCSPAIPGARSSASRSRVRRHGRRARPSWTGDRREFIGRNGTLARPAALRRRRRRCPDASGPASIPAAPCAPPSDLPPRGSVEIVVFLLGQAAGCRRGRGPDRAAIGRPISTRIDGGRRHWDDVLGAVQVKTPDRAMDIMLNGWLLYQTLACRVWARSAFYQSSGAYGFRDQLQDGMALSALAPGDDPRASAARGGAAVRRGRRAALVAARIPGRASARAFPTTGPGSPTRRPLRRRHRRPAVLDETVPFLEGPKLAAGEHDNFFQPTRLGRDRHACSSIARARSTQSLAVGAHGLPLMGTGDWNDGMNRVGDGGQGESVWLGWFLYATLTAFAPHGRGARRHRARRALARACRGAAGRARARGLGRRLVSARLLRRRHRRWGRQRARNAGSIPSPSPGR